MIIILTITPIRGANDLDVESTIQTPHTHTRSAAVSRVAGHGFPPHLNPAESKTRQEP